MRGCRSGHWISTRQHRLSTCCPVEQTQVPFGETGNEKQDFPRPRPRFLQSAKATLAAVNRE